MNNSLKNSKIKNRARRIKEARFLDWLEKRKEQKETRELRKSLKINSEKVLRGIRIDILYDRLVRLSDEQADLEEKLDYVNFKRDIAIEDYDALCEEDERRAND